MASLMRSGRQVSRLILRTQVRTLTRPTTFGHVLRLSQPLQSRTFTSTIHRYQQAEALQDVEPDFTTFQGLEGIVHPNVLQALIDDMGLTTMTEVQTKTLKEALTGNDMYVLFCPFISHSLSNHLPIVLPKPKQELVKLLPSFYL
jgi:ATP-dependent RNA helicase MSS116